MLGQSTNASNLFRLIVPLWKIPREIYLSFWQCSTSKKDLFEVVKLWIYLPSPITTNDLSNNWEIREPWTFWGHQKYCAKYSEILIHQGVRNISVLENFAHVLNEWPLLWRLTAFITFLRNNAVHCTFQDIKEVWEFEPDYVIQRRSKNSHLLEENSY